MLVITSLVNEMIKKKKEEDNWTKKWLKQNDFIAIITLLVTLWNNLRI